MARSKGNPNQEEGGPGGVGVEMVRMALYCPVLHQRYRSTPTSGVVIRCGETRRITGFTHDVLYRRIVEAEVSGAIACGSSRLAAVIRIYLWAALERSLSLRARTSVKLRNFATNKNGGLSLRNFLADLFYAFLALRRMKPKPANPNPTRARDSGSGTLFDTVIDRSEK